MARYVIDALTLLHLVDNELRVSESVQLVAPNSIRSDAMQLLLCDVSDGRRTDHAALETHERITALKMRLLADRVSRRTVDAALAAKAEGIVPVADLSVLLGG